MRYKLTFYHRVTPVRGAPFRDMSPDQPHALIVDGPLRLTAVGSVISEANIDDDNSGRFVAVRDEKRSRRQSDYAFSVPGAGSFRSLFIEALPD